MAIKNIRLKVKSQHSSGYTTLYPTANIVGEWPLDNVISDVYTLTLNASAWNNKTQTLTLSEITATDVPFCYIILSGTAEEMQSQLDAFNLLNKKIGIQSLNGQVKFTCTETPITTFTIQVYWEK